MRFLNNRRKAFMVICLSCAACLSLYLVCNLKSYTHSNSFLVNQIHNEREDSIDDYGTTATTVRRKPNRTFVRTRERPVFVIKWNGEKIFNVVDLSNQSSIDKLKPEDKKELLDRRKRGMFDGIKLQHLEHLLSFVDVPQVPCKVRSKLIILVNSYCGHTERRDGIRRSWGNYSKSLNVHTVFFVGTCEEALAENKVYQDIVQGSFVDNYYNLTFKSLSRVKWFNDYCSNSDFVLLCDDDVLVDTNAILTYYPRHKNLNLLCNKNVYMPILREKNSKWYVPQWLLDGNYFPEYCSGFAYMYNASILPELYERSLDLPYIFVDDAFVSGYAMQEIEKEIHTDGRFILGDRLVSNCNYDSVFASHRYVGEEMVKAWNKRVEKCKYRR